MNSTNLNNYTKIGFRTSDNVALCTVDSYT